ncbi:MAG: nuclear transport factor 2 family protein [Oryzihumus sp.]
MSDAVDPNTACLLRDWHAAVNARDLPTVLRLCTSDVAVTGPRGTGSGQNLMRDWLERSGIRLRLVSLKAFDDGVLAEQVASWPAGTGAQEPVPCVTVFRVRDGKVSAVERYESLEAATAART